MTNEMTTIRVERISNDNFAPFGSVAVLNDEVPLAEGPNFRYWSDKAAFEVDGDTEIGYCTVRKPVERVIDWMERHERTPEVLIPIDWPFILPVMRSNERVEAFEVHPGEAVVIGRNVWHSACLPLGRTEATYFVIFRRGTPHDDVAKTDIEAVALDGTEE